MCLVDASARPSVRERSRNSLIGVSFRILNTASSILRLKLECLYKWMDDLLLYALFNSVSVISGRCLDDNENVCAMEPR